MAGVVFGSSRVLASRRQRCEVPRDCEPSAVDYGRVQSPPGAIRGRSSYPLEFRSANLETDPITSPAMMLSEHRSSARAGATEEAVPPMNDVTHILSAIEQGGPQASGDLLPLVYAELRRLAKHRLAQENPGQTLQATALVHEAYLRLVDAEVIQRWESRGHFFAAAAEAMRRILVENARRKRADKRGGRWARQELDEIEIAAPAPSTDLLALDEALEKLEADEPVKAQLVKLRYFAGLSEEDTARALGISRATVQRHWRYAKAWLLDELHGPADPHDNP
jgi:RNA polymerase sigma factor (TIGR02999 family)